MASRANRKKETGEKREQILLAAIEMFLEKDFYQVTVIEIAERAGVGKGTVYEYFASKEELFKECISYCMESYMQAFREHTTSHKSARAAVKEIVHTHLELLKENRQGLHLLFTERPYNFQELQGRLIDRRQELQQIMADLILLGIEKGEIRPNVDPDMGARLFLAMLYVVMGGMIVIDGEIVSTEQIDKLVELYWRGIEK